MATCIAAPQVQGLILHPDHFVMVKTFFGRRFGVSRATDTCSEICRQMVQSLAALLNVDVTELAALAAADHAERKYGLIAPEVGQDLELAAVATLWCRLASPQRQIILGTMRDFVEHNEQKERAGERTCEAAPSLE